jgi:hypothetical protein
LLSLFNFNRWIIISGGNFKIATGKSLNYERNPFFNCSFWIDDGIHEGGPFIYELTVENNNEAPYFSNIMYHVSTPEGAVRMQ